MVTQIQLGNLFSSGGKNVITGGASGLDVESLVNGLADAKRIPAVALEDKISQNGKVSSALQEMRTLLDSFQDAANFLRNPPGVQNAADDIFEFRTANVSSNSSVAGSTYLSVTAEPGASLANYQIEILNLATRNVQTTDTFAAADTAASVVGGGGPFNAGVLQLGPSGTAITLNAGDTLAEVVSKINAVSDTSGVEASAIKISNGNYRISFKATETGTASNYDISAMNPGVFNVGFAINQVAVDAQIQFDGSTITRSSNSIDDIVEGVTFNLLQQTPVGTTLDVNIEPDPELAKQGILNFIDSYNAFRLFVSRQSETGADGKPLETAVLVNNQAMRLSMSRISAEMSRIVDGIANGDPARLADLGITFSDYPGDEETPFTRNIITIDEDKLDSALASDFDAVAKVFQFNMTADDPNLQVFSRTNGLGVSNFSLNIDQTNQIFEATYDLGSGPVTIQLDKTDLGSGSIVLKGQAGTVLEGLQMIYSDTGDHVVNVNISQGLGDRVYNSLDTILQADTGVMDVELSSLSDENERWTQEISRIDEYVAKFRQRLLEQFSALETAVSQANTLLQSLQAQQDASNNS